MAEDFVKTVKIKADATDLQKLQAPEPTPAEDITLKKLMAGFTMVTAAVTGAAWSITKYIESIGAGVRAAEALGETYNTTGENINNYVKAMENAGVSEKKSIDLLGKVAKAQQEATDPQTTGGKELATLFKDLGVSLEDAEGNARSTVAVLAELSKLELDSDQLKKLGMTTEELSRMEKYSDNVKEVYEYQKLTGSFYKDQLKAANELSTIWRGWGVEYNKLNTFLNEIARAIMVQVTPAIKEFVQYFVKSTNLTYKSIREFLSKDTKEMIKRVGDILSGIVILGKAVLKLSDFIADGVVATVKWFAKLNEKMDGAISYMLGAAAAVGVVMFAMTAPVTATVIAILLLLAVWDDLVTSMEGGESLFDWSWATESVNALSDAWEVFGDLMQWVWEATKAIAQPVLFLLFDNLKGLWNAIMLVINLLTGQWSAAWGNVKSIFEAVSGMIDTIVGGLGRLAESGLKAVGSLLGLNKVGDLKLGATIGSNAGIVDNSMSASNSSIAQSNNINIYGATDSGRTAGAVMGALNGGSNDLMRRGTTVR